MALKKLGYKFVIQTFFATAMLAVATNVLHGIQATEDLLLATVFGGIILGFGVGLILSNNASLDGTEMVSINLSKKLKFIQAILLVFQTQYLCYPVSSFLNVVSRFVLPDLAGYVADA